ncbi:acyl-CoA carboxylase subunit epsilon [Pseudactinotalea sp. HY160]|nr:acyl-CoA carboxylase subunit epsilon [Pseudactinotalea sp. HY160]QGH70934.1 acyl-CoA carboxylase subunit epsilon [Pseudactinotalea sp. HY158]
MGPGDVVRVVRGTPDDVELAALVAGLVAANAAAIDDPDDGSRSSVWADPRRRWGVPAKPSRASWRWSTHQAW